MDKSPHVLMSGPGAEDFAKEHGVELVDAKYFFTQERWDALQKAKAAEKAGGNGDKKFYLTDQTFTARLARLRWIETEILLRRLQPVAKRTSSADELATPQSLAAALMPITPPAPSPAPVTENFSSWPRPRTTFRR